MTRYEDIAQEINDLRTSHSFTRLHTAFYFPLRGKPGWLGCTCSSTPVCFLSHTGLRAQSAPGFPCALVRQRDNEIAQLGRKSRRGNEHVYRCEERSDRSNPFLAKRR